MASAGSTIPKAAAPKAGCSSLPPMRKSRMSRRRIFVLVAVHLVALAHILHWRASGTSITPVEPSEAHELFTYGVINAGLILLAVSVLATLVLGRWFCGWACHVVALQDACAWMLGKLGIRPRPVRARLLAFVPILAAIDVFLLPRILRWIDGQPFPGLRTEMTTDALWETFPGPWMAAATLLVDGFLIVYLLGAKGFCTYGCPYGALFGAADKKARGRIRVTDACEGCGHCTATCTSNVDVRAEVARFGMVVDAGCMKCMDCVSVCPKDALYFGFGPTPEKARGKPLKPKRTWDFSWPEELLMAAVFLGSMYALRGLYGAVPLLLAIGLALILAFATVAWLRLIAQRDFTFQAHTLKAGGRFLAPGIAVLALVPALFAFTVHSGFVQVHSRLGERALLRANEMAGKPEERGTAAYRAQMETALAHLERVEDWGLFKGAGLYHKLGSLALGLGDNVRAEAYLRRSVALDDSFINARIRLAEIMLLEERMEEATTVLAEVLERDPRNTLAGQRLGMVISKRPDLRAARLLFVDLLIRLGNLSGAENGLRPLLEQDPNDPEVAARVAALRAAMANDAAESP